MSTISRLGALVLVTAGTLLTGCATSYVLDNQVQSFSALPALPASATYRFERLPLQQADPSQVQVELIAAPALQSAGWRRDDAAPRYSVQVAAKTQRVVSPYADPWDGWGWGGGWGYSGRGTPWMGRGWGYYHPWGSYEPDWFRREVSIVVRDLATHQVVYETHASNDGPWRDSASVLPAMFHAALQGFPTPPPGPRRVDIQIGGEGKPAS